jgi:hypothetical protein
LTKPNSSLLAYPQFPNPLTESVVRELFTPPPDELRWVWHTSSVPEARLGLLCLLKSFPLLGRFPAPASIPASIAAFLAQHAGLGVSMLLEYPKRTRVRHQVEIRRYLGVHAWSAAPAALATETMQRIVSGRAHFLRAIDRIEIAIDRALERLRSRQSRLGIHRCMGFSRCRAGRNHMGIEQL